MIFSCYNLFTGHQFQSLISIAILTQINENFRGFKNEIVYNRRIEAYEC